MRALHRVIWWPLAIALTGVARSSNARAQEGHHPPPGDSARVDTLTPRRFDAALIADLIGDFTTRGSTLESERRFEVRDVHLAVGAAIDADFRGDFMIALDHRAA
jgi:hypothetical protein